MFFVTTLDWKWAVGLVNFCSGSGINFRSSFTSGLAAFSTFSFSCCFFNSSCASLISSAGFFLLTVEFPIVLDAPPDSNKILRFRTLKLFSLSPALLLSPFPVGLLLPVIPVEFGLLLPILPVELIAGELPLKLLTTVGELLADEFPLTFDEELLFL